MYSPTSIQVLGTYIHTDSAPLFLLLSVSLALPNLVTHTKTASKFIPAITKTKAHQCKSYDWRAVGQSS